MRSIGFGFALLLAASAALATPPPVGSPDYEIMHPYKDWITTQHNKRGGYCCDWADGRPVEAHIVDDHWEAHVTPEHFPGAPDKWVAIPDEKVLTRNPTGSPILWYNVEHDNVYCFAPPDGV